MTADVPDLAAVQAAEDQEAERAELARARRIEELLRQVRRVSRQIREAEKLHTRRVELYRQLRSPELGRVSYQRIGDAADVTGEAVRFALFQEEEKAAGRSPRRSRKRSGT